MEERGEIETNVHGIHFAHNLNLGDFCDLMFPFDQETSRRSIDLSLARLSMLQDIGKRQLHVTDDVERLRRRCRRRNRQRGHNSNFPLLPSCICPARVAQGSSGTTDSRNVR